MNGQASTAIARAFFIESPKPGMDLSSVQPFGRVEVLFTRDDRRPSVFDPTAFVAAVIEALVELEFNVEQDFVVIAGSQLCSSLFLAAAVSYYGKIRVLQWNAQTEKYGDAVLDVTAFEAGDQE